jgi:hypothetical protein
MIGDVLELMIYNLCDNCPVLFFGEVKGIEIFKLLNSFTAIRVRAGTIKLMLVPFE